MPTNRFSILLLNFVACATDPVGLPALSDLAGRTASAVPDLGTPDLTTTSSLATPDLAVADLSCTACGSQCIDLQNDARHCGACGHICKCGECRGGQCGPRAIASGQSFPYGIAVDSSS